MTAAAFIAGVLLGWFALALAGGLLIGAVIRNAEPPADELTVPEPDDIRWDVSA